MRLFTWISLLFSALTTLVLVGGLAVFLVVQYYARDLPDYSQLAEYHPPMVTRLYASDGKLIEEYAKEKRLFIPVHAIPKRLTNAFIAAEDKNFYSHPGVDLSSIFRAGIQNVINVGRGRSLVGGSTITQQVVKNFLLTSERSIDRKIKEALLAYRISRVYSKDRILELYLNEIYLGNRSYGIAAAALDYFNKSVDELTIEEAALLAGLPKAPSAFDPNRNPKRAQERRDWVIQRMFEEGFITEAEAVRATSMPIQLAKRSATEIAHADFFAESVRSQLVAQMSEKTVYEGGLSVRTTLNPTLQAVAVSALRKGIMSYDHRHRYRGPIASLPTLEKWQEALVSVPLPSALLPSWKTAVVLELLPNEARIGINDGSTGVIPLAELSWARRYLYRNAVGPVIKKPSDILKTGDVIVVSRAGGDAEKLYRLEQIPAVNGAIVALDPHTGAVLAMVGGFLHGESQFNRATQAKRQPGSAFKPFVYLSAMERGYSPSMVVVDEPIELPQGPNLPLWKPQNYSGKFYGPTTLRVALENSRNIVTVKLAQMVGIKSIVEIAQRFGINAHPQRNFSMVLGSAETNLLDLTTAYAMLVNGGKRLSPYLVERVQDRNGMTLSRRDTRACDHCVITGETPSELERVPPQLVDSRESIADPIAIYQIVSMLRGVVERGTGKAALKIPHTLAGKTGTTNDSIDAWFVGFSADLVAGVFIGFDTPKSLGRNETGALAALPIWTDFMAEALKDSPDVPFRRPPGVKLVRTDIETGLPATAETSKQNIIYEALRSGPLPDTAPESEENSEQPKTDAPLELQDMEEDPGASGVY